ncbi:hypothetical protein [Nonomuraea pusilla]|uniref:hypothetical protein n=1 Tax=Nonomuraea pusilla TaxID=46177 RepID=UPI0009EA463E
MRRRGAQRGEPRADVDAEVAQDVLFGFIILRLVSGHTILPSARRRWVSPTRPSSCTAVLGVGDRAERSRARDGLDQASSRSTSPSR